MSSNERVRVRQVRQLYARSPGHRAFFGDSAAGERARSQTTIDTIMGMLDARRIEFKRYDVTPLLKNLETTKVGVYVAGRGDKPSRFLWSHNLIEVGKSRRGRCAGTRSRFPPQLFQ